MDKKIDWGTVEELVVKMLQKYPFTRNNDALLECMIVQELGYGEYRFTDVMMNRKKYNIPNFSTIERARRKVQNEYPELQAIEEVKKERFDLQNSYEGYGLNKELL